MSLAELVVTMKAKREEIVALAKSEGEKAIKAALKEMFAEHSTLGAIRWQQYTPYFNDGDPCEFSVNEAEYLLVGEDLDSEDWHDLWSKADPIAKSVKEFSKAIEALDDSMEMMFGDHVQVTCTREKISVDSYDHD